MVFADDPKPVLSHQLEVYVNLKQQTRRERMSSAAALFRYR